MLVFVELFSIDDTSIPQYDVRISGNSYFIREAALTKGKAREGSIRNEGFSRNYEVL